MAFVHRTSRDTCRIGGFNPKTSETSELPNLAPGCYDTISGVIEQEKRTKIQGTAPFSTSAKRLKESPTGTAQTPGPGAYAREDHHLYEASSASAAFKSTSERKIGAEKNAGELPGPGAYDTLGTSKLDQRGRYSGRHLEKKPKVVVLPKHTTTPSIPFGNQANGYIEDSQGNLIPRKVQRSSASIEETNIRSSAKPRGIDFTRLAPRERKKMIREETPGPGHYSASPAPAVERTSSMQQRRPPPTGLRSKESRAASPKKRADSLPGPGSYSLDATAAIQLKPKHGQCRDGFGSTSKRFKPFKQSSGPGFYAAPSMFAEHESNNVRYIGKRVPFSSAAPKFAPPKMRSDGPPVGTYRIPGMADEIEMKLALAPRSGTAPFGTSSRRFRDQRERPLTERRPGSRITVTDTSVSTTLVPYRSHSSQGDVKRKKKKHASKQGFVGPCTISAAIKAQAKSTVTFGVQKVEQDGTPAPGQYDTLSAHSIAAEVKKKMAGKGIMLSKTDRFGNVCSNEKDSLGPGAYFVEKSTLLAARRGGTSSMFSSQAKRFNHTNVSSSTPGPGHYDVATDNLVQLTYNLTIAEEEERALRQRNLL